MSSILKPLVELLHWVLVWIHDALASMGLGRQWTWGLAIIGLTIIVRLIMFPLTWKQYKSSRAMQALAPHIKELQKKHKGDRATLQQETMKLYQEHRVNPFASCLPLILQLPVFFALYWTIKGTDYLPKSETVALATAPFLWLPHLGKPDPYYILLVIYIVTQLVSTELMLTPQTDKTQKMMMRAMPIMFVFFLKNFPSGLFVYWVTTNLWTIGQQLVIRKTMPLVALEAAAGSSGGGAKARQGRTAAQEAEPLHGDDDGRPGAAQGAARGAPQGRLGRDEGGRLGRQEGRRSGVAAPPPSPAPRRAASGRPRARARGRSRPRRPRRPTRRRQAAVPLSGDRRIPTPRVIGGTDGRVRASTADDTSAELPNEVDDRPEGELRDAGDVPLDDEADEAYEDADDDDEDGAMDDAAGDEVEDDEDDDDRDDVDEDDGDEDDRRRGGRGGRRR